MPIHKSVIKRERQTKKRRERNRMVLSRLKTLIKKTHAVIESSNLEGTTEQLKKTISAIHKAASKGIIHPNNASRRISRLTLKANKLTFNPPPST
ncbi:MAG: 30S ribosomal protein S20 [Nitrospirota bacterium]